MNILPRRHIANAARIFGVPVLGMAFTAHEAAYRKKGIAMIGEFYADLAYDGDGVRIPRERVQA